MATAKKAAAEKTGSSKAKGAAASGEKAESKKKATSKKGGAAGDGGAKAPEAPASAPFLLANGKTPANREVMMGSIRTYATGSDTAEADSECIALLPKLEQMTDAELALAVRAHLERVFAKHTCTDECSNDQISDCPKVRCDSGPLQCMEVATYETDACPFCGSKGEPAAAVPESQEQPVEEAAPGEAPAATEEPAAAGEEVVEPSTPETAEEIIPVAEGGAPEVSSTAETAEQLAAAEASIRQLKENMGANLYDLGKALKEIHERELWLSARDGEGKPRFKNFQQYVEEVLDIKKSLAYDMMDVVEKFSRQQFLFVGSKSIRLIAGVEDEKKREELLERAKGGATSREIEREVRGGRSAPEKTGGGSRATPEPEKGGKKTASAPKEDTVEVVIKKHKKPVTESFRSSKTGNALKAWAEDSYVEFTLGDGAVFQVGAVMKDGKLVALTGQVVKVIDAK